MITELPPMTKEGPTKCYASKDQIYTFKHCKQAKGSMQCSLSLGSSCPSQQLIRSIEMHHHSIGSLEMAPMQLAYHSAGNFAVSSQP